MVVAEKTCQVVVVNNVERVSMNWGSSMIDMIGMKEEGRVNRLGELEVDIHCSFWDQRNLRWSIAINPKNKVCKRYFLFCRNYFILIIIVEKGYC